MAGQTEGSRQEAIKSLRGRFEEVKELSAISDGGLSGFLAKAKWSVDDAAVLLQTHLKWRAEHLPVSRSEVAEVLEAERIAVLEGACSGGNPVLLLNFQRLMQVDFSQKKEMDVHLRATVYCAEEMISRMPPDISQWVAIINCAGIVMPPTAYLQAFQNVFKANYPERVHKIIMYPVPKWVVRFVQSMMWFVPSKTRDKVSFVDTLEGLCEETGLDREQLPEELLRSRPASHADVPTAPPGAAVLEVAACTATAHCHPLGAGACVEWEMHTLAHNIIFGLRFLPTASGAAPEEIASPEKMAGRAGAFTAEQDGVLEFALDNSFSIMTGKTVFLSVRNAAAGDPAISKTDPPYLTRRDSSGSTASTNLPYLMRRASERSIATGA